MEEGGVVGIDEGGEGVVGNYGGGERGGGMQ